MYEYTQSTRMLSKSTVWKAVRARIRNFVEDAGPLVGRGAGGGRDQDIGVRLVQDFFERVDFCKT